MARYAHHLFQLHHDT
jgi:chromosome segregation ATPase